LFSNSSLVLAAAVNPAKFQMLRKVLRVEILETSKIFTNPTVPNHLAIPLVTVPMHHSANSGNHLRHPHQDLHSSHNSVHNPFGIGDDHEYELTGVDAEHHFSSAPSTGRSLFPTSVLPHHMASALAASNQHVYGGHYAHSSMVNQNSRNSPTMETVFGPTAAAAAAAAAAAFAAAVAEILPEHQHSHHHLHASSLLSQTQQNKEHSQLSLDSSQLTAMAESQDRNAEAVTARAIREVNAVFLFFLLLSSSASSSSIFIFF
jgi:hypothetical protein